VGFKTSSRQRLHRSRTPASSNSLAASCRRGRHIGGLRAVLVAAALLPATCSNSPYPESQESTNVLYTTFSEEPAHMDPAIMYGSAEFSVLGNVLEPLFQYHFLKRPYELAPLLAREVPRPEHRKVTYEGRSVEATVYTVRLRPGILYQDHPCFVEANRRLSEEDLRGIRGVEDFRRVATREMVAGDFVHAVRRLADPRLDCPLYGTFEKNLLGMGGYRKALVDHFDRERQARSAAAGPLYNRELDEMFRPIPVDYAEGAERFPFVRQIDRYSFEVVLSQPYPRILYWMATTFFAPVPPEAVEFFSQPGLLERSIVLDRNPVGTGPYVLRQFDPTNQIVLERNRNFRVELYPDLPLPATDDAQGRANYEMMKAAGMLDDVGRRLPMVDRIVYRMERESIPRWNKFLQGYYDNSGIQSDVFDQAVTLSSRGEASLTDELAGRGIRLLTDNSAVLYYYAFNMTDPVFGGYTDRQRKLRQAISIALDAEEGIAIFANGRGVPAQSPIPPGIFGHEEGAGGVNPVVYRWDASAARAVRRPLADARKLLAEAGYPDGYSAEGKPLEVRFITGWSSPEGRSRLMLIRKQLDRLNIRLVVETSDYNRFNDKLRSGNFQLVRLGWAADYPDPENFLFLFHQPDANKPDQQNPSRYDNRTYNELFVRMRGMENSPERLAVIRQMLGVLREDAPAVFDHHPAVLGLHHDWYHNAYPHAMAFNTMKYVRIDPARRAEYVRQANAPRWWPVAALAGVLAILTIPAVRAAVRHLRET
jgi:oligopeptide transport system substrate-binding protein